MQLRITWEHEWPTSRLDSGRDKMIFSFWSESTKVGQIYPMVYAKLRFSLRYVIRSERKCRGLVRDPAVMITQSNTPKQFMERF